MQCANKENRNLYKEGINFNDNLVKAGQKYNVLWKISLLYHNQCSCIIYYCNHMLDVLFTFVRTNVSVQNWDQ
jgi:hypothetical protein